MKRYTFAAKVKPGKQGLFRKTLGVMWPEIVAFLNAQELTNFSLWQAEDLVFGYCEATGHEERDLTGYKDLFAAFSKSVTMLSDGPMRLMYTDLGKIRKDKSLIRHRVFMTKLVPGSEEEYRARHKALEDARTEPTPGPDSNFTIWSAGGYIFGYDEIDVTMEKDMTDEERESTIAWETRMFEIMSWITNDCDWISHENHVAVQKIASR